jgi:chemotaxis protein MotB
MPDKTTDLQETENRAPFSAHQAERLRAMNRELFERDEDMPGMHWSVPWSDLMMTMFILFTVLFVYASAKRDYLQAFHGHVSHEQVRDIKELGSRQAEVPVYDKPTRGALPDIGPERLYQMCKAAVDETGLDDVQVKMDGAKVLISMHGPMLFDRTEAEIKPPAKNFLNSVASVIAKARYQVVVHGHTDNFPVSTPKYETNWELSAARACAVVRYLIEKKNANPALFTVAGHSMYKPASPNLTAEGKARNRRVEIELRRPDKEET